MIKTRYKVQGTRYKGKANSLEPFSPGFVFHLVPCTLYLVPIFHLCATLSTSTSPPLPLPWHGCASRAWRVGRWARGSAPVGAKPHPFGLPGGKERGGLQGHVPWQGGPVVPWPDGFVPKPSAHGEGLPSPFGYRFTIHPPLGTVPAGPYLPGCHRYGATLGKGQRHGIPPQARSSGSIQPRSEPRRLGK